MSRQALFCQQCEAKLRPTATTCHYCGSQDLAYEHPVRRQPSVEAGASWGSGRQAMERAISRVPGASRTLSETRPYLLQVADQMQDDILGILTGAVTGSGLTDMCFVVTPVRIVGVSSRGSVEAWRYQDIKLVRVFGGKKKLLGGHETSFFQMEFLDGTSLSGPLFGDYEYIHRIGAVAENACRKAQISRL